MDATELISSWRGALVDAHRHGLYDISPHWSLAGVPVEKWSEDPRFLEHERRTKGLFGDALRAALLPWIDFSLAEGVGTVLDFSGKHARGDVEHVYRTAGVRSHEPVFWSSWNPNACPAPAVMILPDERELDAEAAAAARSFLAATPGGRITLHAGESDARMQIGKARLGRSIVEWLARESLLNERTVLVHGNALALGDYELVGEACASIVLCPLTRAALHNPAPLVPLKVRVFFGTDAPLVSGSRSLVDQAVAEARRWISLGSDGVAAAERAAVALMRPLGGEEPLEVSRAQSALASFLFDKFLKVR